MGMIAGSDLDLDALYSEHASRIHAFAYRMLGDRDAALDVVQEVFAAAVAGADTFRGDANPLTWLTAIARNLCLKRLGRVRERTFEDFEAVIEAHAHPPEALESDAERRIYEAEVKEGCLIGLAQCLSVDQRTVFVLHILNDWSIAEIARIMDRSPNSVRILLSRARAAIRRFLCAHCALLGGRTCECSAMIDFSLDRGLIERYRPDADAVAADVREFADEIELYRSLPDRSAEIVKRIASFGH